MSAVGSRSFASHVCISLFILLFFASHYVSAAYTLYLDVTAIIKDLLATSLEFLSDTFAPTGLSPLRTCTSSIMAPEQDEHRNKRARTVNEAGNSSTSSATHLAPRRNVQPRPLAIPCDLASNNLFAPESHNSRGRASPDLNDNIVDASSSRGNVVALPFRDRGKGVLLSDTNQSVTENSKMMDAALISADDEDGEVSLSEGGYQHGEDGTFDRSSSKGKEKALSNSEDSGPGGLIGAEDRSNRAIQIVTQNSDMENSGNEYWNDEDREDEDDNGDVSIGRYGVFHQVHPAETVDPPVQEVLVGEDGTLEIRPEDLSGRELGNSSGAGN